MEFKMPAQAHPAGLKLRVKELDRALTFYTGLLGLEQEADTDARLGPDGLRLGLPGRRFFLDLVEDPGAGLRPYPSVGLYHFALLLPDRRSLGSVFQKLIQAGWDFEGAADHGVSEALYLRDPENNGIELYRDRPKESWNLDGNLVRMVTEPLDVRGLLEESPEPAPLDAQTALGHMHLHVDDLGGAARFYGEALGLANRASLPGAEFLAAGDYHHHLGLNTWAGTRRAGARTTGLLEYTWEVPPGAMAGLVRGLEDAMIEFESGTDLGVTDPIGIGVRLFEGTPDSGSGWGEARN